MITVFLFSSSTKCNLSSIHMFFLSQYETFCIENTKLSYVGYVLQIHRDQTLNSLLIEFSQSWEIVYYFSLNDKPFGSIVCHFRFKIQVFSEN